jgi:hypothetical protein
MSIASKPITSKRKGAELDPENHTKRTKKPRKEPVRIRQLSRRKNLVLSSCQAKRRAGSSLRVHCTFCKQDMAFGSAKNHVLSSKHRLAAGLPALTFPCLTCHAR